MGTAGASYYFLGAKEIPFIPRDRCFIHMRNAFRQIFPIKFSGPADHGSYKFIKVIACRYCVKLDGGCCMHQC